MGMRIACAHHGAAVFENLDVVDVGHFAQLTKLFHPGADDQFDGVNAHGGQREIVTRRKTHHAAEARFALSDE
jgi:hypothetical protein